MNCSPLLRVTGKNKRKTSQTDCSELGATLVEFTMVALFIVMFLIASIELLRMAFTAVTLQFAVSAALRHAVVSTDDADEIAQDLIEIARGLTLHLNTDPRDGDTEINISHRQLRAGGNTWSPGAGGEDSLIRIEAVRRLSILHIGEATEYTLSGLAIGVRDQ
jgi:hypothetical protein